MSSKSKVPDAWDDDDWESQADKDPAPVVSQPEGSAKISKAERRAKQAEFNRKLWEEAEAPDAPYFVESKGFVPVQSDLKPSVKVLSRKPAPNMIARRDPLSGIQQLVIDDDDEDDETANKQKPLSAEEQRLKSHKEREEKQRKYEEARERLFGVSNPTSGSNSPINVTPPPIKSSNDKNRGRGRGGGRDGRDSRPTSSAGNKARQLYDPNYTVKPDSGHVQRKETSEPSVSAEEQIIRSPRGPDGTGRGGFGFLNRGGKIT